MENDELDELFVDKNEPVDKKILVEILKGRVTIDKEGVINLTELGEKLPDNKKALIYLSSRKAMVIKGFIEPEKEFVGPNEISKAIGIGLSSAKKATNNTFKKLLINKSGKYIIANYNLKKIKEIILGKNSESKNG